MSKQTAVRLPDELHSRLQALAARTGRTATYYIREAIEEHLDDLEDIYLAEDSSTTWKRENRDALVSSNDWVENNGLPLDQFRQF